MLMAPLVRRTSSVRGRTPILRQREVHLRKVTAIATI